MSAPALLAARRQRQWILSAGDTERDTEVAIRNLGRQIDAEEHSNFTSLLAAFIKRVQGYLSDPDCARNFRDSAAAIRKTGTVGFSNQGVVQYTTQPNGEIAGRRDSPGVARGSKKHRSTSRDPVRRPWKPTGQVGHCDCSRLVTE